jgi:CheY-like chemotaxis protein
MKSLKKILCVDDEPDIRNILVMALQFTLKAEVVALGSAEEAFAYLEQNPLPDVLLLDGMMPGIDGYTACAKLRADARFATLPIVFLTAKTQRAEKERALAAGATACLGKPFDPMTVGQDLKTVLEGKK